MNQFITTQAIVLKTSNLGEYDKRLVMLTSDFGKITVFAKGVRRQNSKFLAACSPFSYGQLQAFPGREAYSFMDFAVSEFFEKLRSDFEASCMGMYFLEVADYYTRENNDDMEMFKLLYTSLRALTKTCGTEPLLDQNLVRRVFELRTLMVNGEYPGRDNMDKLSDGAEYALYYVETAPLKKLFAFSVSDKVLAEISDLCDGLCRRFMDRHFNSLDMILT